MAKMKKIGADTICSAQAQRHYDFRKGEKLGKNDHIVFWKKPQKPASMLQSEYDAYPAEINVREFKVSGVVYVTTFLNYKAYNKKELVQIYKIRWHIETNFNHIKTTMNMDMLSCKTPDMVRKEIGIHFLAYNIIRILMAEACQKYKSTPRCVSFKGAIQLINEFMPYFSNLDNQATQKLYTHMLQLIVKNKTGNRPNRIEPRLIKQRQKPFPTLKKPRSIEKNSLMIKAKKRKAKYAEA